MKAQPLVPAVCLWLLVPSVAHASSFALVLYPFGALTAIVIVSVFLARGKSVAIRITSALAAIITATCVPLLPSSFYSSSSFEHVQSWLGEWIFFILGLLPTALIAILVLRLGAHTPSRPDA
jgi:hypothetical protein